MGNQSLGHNMSIQNIPMTSFSPNIASLDYVVNEFLHIFSMLAK